MNTVHYPSTTLTALHNAWTEKKRFSFESDKHDDQGAYGVLTVRPRTTGTTERRVMAIVLRNDFIMKGNIV
jgi:hypothetical protein